MAVIVKGSVGDLICVEDNNQRTKLFQGKASSLLASLLVMPHVPMLYVRVESTYALKSLIRLLLLTFCLQNQSTITL